jgi:hypothetical protein
MSASRPWTAILAAAAVFAAGACQPSPEDELDEAAFEAMALATEDELNAAASQIYAVLQSAASRPQVGWDELYVNLDGTPEPVNWWFYRRGWLELSGAQFVSRPVFTVSQSGRQVIETAGDYWFIVQRGEEAPEVTCESMAAISAGGCEVTMVLYPQITDQGLAALGSRTLEPVTVSGTVRLGAQDWEVPDLALRGSVDAWELGLNEILGEPDVRQAAHAAASDEVMNRIARLSGEREPERGERIFEPPPYVEPPAPVAPIGAEAPQNGALGLGLPDAVTGR